LSYEGLLEGYGYADRLVRKV